MITFWLDGRRVISLPGRRVESRLLGGWQVRQREKTFFLLPFLLLVMAAASVLYLVHEQRLKTKRPNAFFDRLPPLGTLDELQCKAGQMDNAGRLEDIFLKLTAAPDMLDVIEALRA